MLHTERDRQREGGAGTIAVINKPNVELIANQNVNEAGNHSPGKKHTSLTIYIPQARR